MGESETAQNHDGTWALWIGQTYIKTDFITIDAALKWAQEHLAELQDEKAQEETIAACGLKTFAACAAGPANFLLSRQSFCPPGGHLRGSEV
ncbi:MAG: hypothetical protein WBX25_31645 [Rhodomicrobium sp.]